MSWFKKDKPRKPSYTIKVERSRIDKSFVGIIYEDEFCHKGMVFAPTAKQAESAALDWIQDDLNGKNGWITKVYVEGWVLPSEHTKHMLTIKRSDT